MSNKIINIYAKLGELHTRRKQTLQALGTMDQEIESYEKLLVSTINELQNTQPKAPALPSKPEKIINCPILKLNNKQATGAKK